MTSTNTIALRQHILSRNVLPGATVYLRESNGKFGWDEWTYERQSEKGYLQVKRHGEYRAIPHNEYLQIKVLP